VRTERLVLRTWCDSDRAPFAALNADPVVMEFYSAPLTTAQSDAFVDRIEQAFAEHGWGLWAVEHVDCGAFIGYVGLAPARFEASFTPAVEIGWRLSRDHWGRGYATEGARAALEYGFTTLGLEEIVSFTAPSNVRSQRVMQKLGMTRDPDGDFDHPNVAEGHPIRPHVLFRLAARDASHAQEERGAGPTLGQRSAKGRQSDSGHLADGR
jgi:ribosomal-protein-alanine N-acetyltransferase